MNIDELLNRYFEGETSAEEAPSFLRFRQCSGKPVCLQTFVCLFR